MIEDTYIIRDDDNSLLREIQVQIRNESVGIVVFEYWKGNGNKKEKFIILYPEEVDKIIAFLTKLYK